MPQSVLLVERGQWELPGSCLLDHFIPCSTIRVSVADCRVGQTFIGTSPNHFYLGLIEHLEYKQEHTLDAVLFCTNPSHICITNVCLC